ncbi:hypothetical protein DFQ28_011097, partial [Apophysomyces sp. BC1034]
LEKYTAVYKDKFHYDIDELRTIVSYGRDIAKPYLPCPMDYWFVSPYCVQLAADTITVKDYWKRLIIKCLNKGQYEQLSEELEEVLGPNTWKKACVALEKLFNTPVQKLRLVCTALTCKQDENEPLEQFTQRFQQCVYDAELKLERGVLVDIFLLNVTERFKQKTEAWIF